MATESANEMSEIVTKLETIIRSSWCYALEAWMESLGEDVSADGPCRRRFISGDELRLHTKNSLSRACQISDTREYCIPNASMADRQERRIVL